MISLRDGEFVHDFAMRLFGIIHQLELRGDPIDDKNVVAKYLRVVPPKFA